MYSVDKEFRDIFNSFQDIFIKIHDDLDSNLIAYKELIQSATGDKFFSDDEKAFAMMVEIEKKIAAINHFYEWMKINHNFVESIKQHNGLCKALDDFKEKYAVLNEG